MNHFIIIVYFICIYYFICIKMFRRSVTSRILEPPGRETIKCQLELCRVSIPLSAAARISGCTDPRCVTCLGTIKAGREPFIAVIKADKA